MIPNLPPELDVLLARHASTGQTTEEPPIGVDAASFVGAYHGGSPVFALWAYVPEAHRVLYAASPNLSAPHDRYRRSGLKRLRQTLSTYRWVARDLCTHDVGAPGGKLDAHSLEDVVLSSTAPVVWILEAAPVHKEAGGPWEELARQADRTVVGGSAEKVEAERLLRVLEHLEAEAGEGLWTARLHVGSSSEAGIDRLLGLLLSSRDAQSIEATVTFEGVPIVGSSAIASLGRRPAREVPGIRVSRLADWDMTPETSGEIKLGRIVGDSGGEFDRMSVPLSTINRHAFVCGATGSGKSETVRRLLTELSGNGVPWMVVEPAKAEYGCMAGIVGEANFRMIRLGDLATPPPSLNPLEPSRVTEGDHHRMFPLSTHLSLVGSLFQASFKSEEPFPQILELALERCYREAGWDTATGGLVHGGDLTTARYPTLEDLRRSALRVVDGLGYGREVSDNVRGFVDVRINSLRSGAAGRFLENGHPLDLEELFGRNVVLQIEDVGDEGDQAFVMGVLIIRWSEMLRLRGDSNGSLRHVLVLEEAHRLLRNTGGEVERSVEQFANLLAEIRAYGEGVVVAEQIPAKIIPDVVKNSALKIMHRMPSLDDRDTVGATMNLTKQQSAGVVAFEPGECAIHADGMDRPVRARIPRPPEPKPIKLSVAVAELPHTFTCGTEFGPNLCPVEQIETARRLADDWAFQAWVDVFVIAYVCGGQLPALDSGLAVRFKAQARRSRRTLTCAVGLAARRSVKARQADLPASFNVPQFEVLISHSVMAVLKAEAPAAVPEPEWLLGRFRWADVLASVAECSTEDRPDPEVLDRCRLRGLVVDGVSSIAELRERLDDDTRYVLRTAAETAWGTPSVLQEALRRSGTSALRDLFEQLGCESLWLRRVFEFASADQAGVSGGGG